VYGLVVGDEMVWCRWLQWVEAAYLENAYHNATHACDVLQTVHFFLAAGARPLFSDTQLLALLLSAIVHDLGHDGLNNAFHKGSMSDRALSHNDRSIQESYHISTAFTQTLSNPAINIFALLERSAISELRSLMITMVLATDMSFHFEHLASFKKMVDTHGTEYDSYLPEEIPHLCCVLLHAADVSNPGKPAHLAKHWAVLVVKEFFNQGAQEKLLGLPISPNCDPKATAMENVQIGFIRFIVLPFFTQLAEFLPQVGVQCVPQLHANLAYWQSVAKQTEAEKKTSNEAAQKAGSEAPKKASETSTAAVSNPDKSKATESPSTTPSSPDRSVRGSTPSSPDKSLRGKNSPEKKTGKGEPQEVMRHSNICREAVASACRHLHVQARTSDMLFSLCACVACFVQRCAVSHLLVRMCM